MSLLSPGPTALPTLGLSRLAMARGRDRDCSALCELPGSLQAILSPVSFVPLHAVTVPEGPSRLQVPPLCDCPLSRALFCKPRHLGLPDSQLCLLNLESALPHSSAQNRLQTVSWSNRETPPFVPSSQGSRGFAVWLTVSCPCRAVSGENKPGFCCSILTRSIFSLRWG